VPSPRRLIGDDDTVFSASKSGRLGSGLSVTARYWVEMLTRPPPMISAMRAIARWAFDFDA
jgi:hypothetical protein